VSTWKFVEGVEVGDMEYGSGYPSGTAAHHVICQAAALVFTGSAVLAQYTVIMLSSCVCLYIKSLCYTKMSKHRIVETMFTIALGL